MTLRRWLGWNDQAVNPRRRGHRRPALELLEGRELLSAIYSVTNLNDSGTGSLRDAIAQSNASSGTATNTINFSISGSGVQTIKLLSSLSVITHPVVIDGSTQPGFSGKPLIVIDGTSAGTGANGFEIAASKTTIKGLAIDNFNGDGVWVHGVTGGQVTGVRITSDYIGVDPTGTAAKGNGLGVFVNSLNGPTTATTISGDVISGNTNQGIVIGGGPTMNNVVTNCKIGTNSAGTAAIGNGLAGVQLQNGTNHNTIGGTAAGTGNLISGNLAQGIDFVNNASVNVVQGNLIGTNAAGTAAIANKFSGIAIWTSSSGNRIGGTAAGAGNVISGNLGTGVRIIDQSDGNRLQGNFIGTNKAGTAPLPNGASGVSIEDSSHGNLVGGTSIGAGGAGNLISGNTGDGISLSAAGNFVQSNFIGTNAAGTSAIANSTNGIEISGSGDSQTIGGITAGTGNVISGNTLDGIYFHGTDGGTVQGNLIGTNSAGNLALANGSNGVEISGDADTCTIGGTAPGSGNVISGNLGNGILISGVNCFGVGIYGNSIGTSADHTLLLGNASQGVLVASGAYNNEVGGEDPGAGNFIANNKGAGVSISGAGTGNIVEYDTINSNGASQSADAGDGVYIYNSPWTSVIGCSINSNRDWGIYSFGSGTPTMSGNVFNGNGKGTVKVV